MSIYSDFMADVEQKTKGKFWEREEKLNQTLGKARRSVGKCKRVKKGVYVLSPNGNNVYSIRYSEDKYMWKIRSEIFKPEGDETRLFIKKRDAVEYILSLGD